VLVRNLWLSVDPAQRTWMTRDSYKPKVAVGFWNCGKECHGSWIRWRRDPDSIAFGRPYIANPDLPERFLAGATLDEVSWPTVYASGPEGYTDYPSLSVPAGLMRDPALLR